MQRCTLTTPTHAPWYASCPNPFLPSLKILGCLAHSKGVGAHFFSYFVCERGLFPKKTFGFVFYFLFFGGGFYGCHWLVFFVFLETTSCVCVFVLEKTSCVCAFSGQKRHFGLTLFLNICKQIMRFEKQQKKPICIPPSATDHYIFCCCGKRQDNENRAGRVGKMVTLWHCSGCTSVRGKGLLAQRCADGEEKFRVARGHLKKAKLLEREFSERVTNPERMSKTGEVNHFAKSMH